MRSAFSNTHVNAFKYRKGELFFVDIHALCYHMLIRIIYIREHVCVLRIEQCSLSDHSPWDS